MHKIVKIVGTPSQDVFDKLHLEPDQKQVAVSLPVYPKTPFHQMFPQSSALLTDLLDKMLQFEPSKRITAADALAHPFFAKIRNPKHETKSDFQLNYNLEDKMQNLNQIPTLIDSEIAQYYKAPEIHDEDEYVIIENNVPSCPNVAKMYGIDDDIVMVDADDFNEFD